MSSPSETSRVSLLLTNRLVEVDAQPFTAREYWTLVERVDDLATLLGVSASDLVQIVGSVEEAERVTTLLGASTAFAFEQERLEEGGIAVLSSSDDRFPTTLRQRLGPACPPFLLVAGPIDWLDGNALGVVGSRETSDEMLAVADAAAAAAVDAGWAVVSGLARGVDQAAMKGALDRGGRVIGVPAEGIRRSARNAEIRRHVHAGDLCIVSPYGPDAPFTSGTAMGRNKIVHAISTNTLVVATSDGSGGTWAGAKESLTHSYSGVFVWAGHGAPPGNAALERLGACPVTAVADALRMVEPQPSLQATLF